MSGKHGNLRRWVEMMKVLWPHHHQRARQNAVARVGFTLVEILIVISIIGVLGAILLSALAGARDKSRTISCASNLRQIGLAMQIYLADSRGFYPTYHPGPPNCSWADRIYPYLKAPEVLWCPDFEAGEYRPGCTPSETIGGVKQEWNGSYSINTLEDAIWEVGRTQPSVPERRVRFPASTILVLDGTGSGYVNPGIYAAMTSLAELEAKNIPDRHRGGANVLFADWHVKWMAMSSLLKRNQWRASGSN